MKSTKVNRIGLLEAIQGVMPGTDSSGSSLSQSDCIVFKNQVAYSFNDEVAVRADVPLAYEGAMDASKLLLVLQKLDEETITMDILESKVKFRGKRREGTIAINPKIELPLSLIELPTRWRPTHPDLPEALAVISRASGRDENKYTLTCVHITPKHVEASDNIQIMRWDMETGIRKKTLIAGHIANMLSRYNIVESGLTKGWIHFKDDKGLIFSVRTHEDEYPDMTPFLDIEGEAVTFPPDIGEASSRAASFLSSTAEDEILVSLHENKMVMESDSDMVQYKEDSRVDYSGPAISFYIHPQICGKLSKDAKDTIINSDRIKVTSDNWEYVAVLQSVGEE